MIALIPGGRPRPYEGFCGGKPSPPNKDDLAGGHGTPCPQRTRAQRGVAPTARTRVKGAKKILEGEAP